MLAVLACVEKLDSDDDFRFRGSFLCTVPVLYDLDPHLTCNGGLQMFSQNSSF